MNSIVDVLFLRRPAIDYVSPAICESTFSGSSFPVIVLNPLDRLLGPTGFVLGGNGSLHKLSWNNYPGALCYSVYKLVDELDPNGAYQLIAECITDTFFDPDPGTYRISAITPDGETPLSDPLVVPPVVSGGGGGDVFGIALLGLDEVNDLSENANAVAGRLDGFGAAYKNGFLFAPSPLSTSTDGAFFAVSPNGNIVVGYDHVGGFDHATSYNFAALSDLGAGAFSRTGNDVSNDGAVITTGSSGKHLIDATSGVDIADVGIAFTGQAVFFETKPRILNNARQLVCRSGVVDGRKLYRWESGVKTDISPADIASNAFNSKPLGITEAGHSFGTFTDNSTRDLTWYNNGISTITLPFSGFVTARAMNESNTIVGQADNGFSFYTAFKWTSLGGLEFLPSFPDIADGAQAVAMDVNDAGWIVGTMDSQGFLYHDGEIFKLIDLIPGLSGWDSIESAVFINNLKTIVGQGTYLGAPGTWYIITIT